MSRLSIITPNLAQTTVERLYKELESRIVASPPGLCPVDMAASFLKLCHSQTCGKCTPCRIGLGQLENLLEDVLEGRATLKTLDLNEKTAQVVADSADCAIGYEAAEMVLRGLKGFREDYIEHITNNRCTFRLDQPVPCVSQCPANVDIPGYIALVNEGRYDDAVKLIRKDNPFVVACAYICEHPCENRCRRNMIDSSVNIRGLKRYAVDHAKEEYVPTLAEPTGKTVAVVGGGPGGLSAAYYLAIMGHKVTVYEQRSQLGGMLRYGIPSYRLPRKKLDDEIKHILSTGIEVHTNVSVGKDITLKELKDKYDSVYISIGAHTDKKIGIEGEDANNVISAVEMLRQIGDGTNPDFKGKKVVVVGGGNVAMDVVRSSVRLGAEKTTCVYRRRKEDMTALVEEIEGAIAEGVELVTLKAPLKIEKDENGNAKALWVQPQIIGKIDKMGRPSPSNASVEPQRIEADIIVISIGQGIESREFEKYGIPVKRGIISALDTGEITNHEGIFAGGDCVTGPATVIRAIAAGKVAAANVDEYLGFHHEIKADVVIPNPKQIDKIPCGRVNMAEREASERKNDFECIEFCMTCEEANQESNRCLRCDKYGFGIFKGGRIDKW